MIRSLLGWSKWSDILCFNYGGESFLLQGRKHKRTNAKIFKITKSKQYFSTFIATCQTMTEEKLVKAGLFQQIKGE